MMSKGYSKMLLLLLPVVMLPVALSASDVSVNRRLVASINKVAEACYPSKDFSSTNDRILISWRKLPSDGNNTTFNLYREQVGRGNGRVKLNSSPITTTNFSDTYIESSYDRVYTLTDANDNILDTFTLPKEQLANGHPFFTIPTQSTEDIAAGYKYILHDASVGDLDGDGEPEIVVRREIKNQDVDQDVLVDENTTMTVNPWVTKDVLHSEIWEAYKMNGTRLWRLLSGPNIATGNSASFAVYDFDGDGCCEVALRTCEGFVFGDGQTIGDTNGDGITDYRDGNTGHIPANPDFISVIDGKTGRELARDSYIPMGTSSEWGDNYYKRANSLRVGAAKVDGGNTAIIICRGIYGKMAIEAWGYADQQLTRKWHWNCGTTKDDPYFGQGNHSLSVGDVDGDGFDEIVYGACTIDNDGTAKYSSALGHGDALHLGKFSPDAEGLQIWSCFENDGGRAQYQCKNLAAALRNGADGEIIWSQSADPERLDCGRALIADIDPTSPGCEMWYYKGNVLSNKGEDLGYGYSSINMAVWFDGRLSRQLLDGTMVDSYYPDYADNSGKKFKRPLQMNAFGATSITAAGLKKFPVVYGDFLGDWREEIVMAAADETTMMVFTTWYPTEYSLPYLRSDHLYDMSMVNQNIGYNMPTQLGYYLFNSSVTIGSLGYAVYVPSCNVMIPSGIKAYYATGDGVNSEQTRLTLTEIEEGTIVNGGEAIILKGEADCYTFTPTSSSAAVLEGNLLKSFAYYPPSDLSKIFVFGKNDGGEAGFYRYSGSMPTFGIYLDLPNGAQRVKGFSLDFGNESLGIEGLTGGQPANDHFLYNLAGQRVNGNYKGIIIKNGKKCLTR